MMHYKPVIVHNGGFWVGNFYYLEVVELKGGIGQEEQLILYLEEEPEELWLLCCSNFEDMPACWPQGLGQALLGRNLKDGGLAGGVEGGGEKCCRVCHEDVC